VVGSGKERVVREREISRRKKWVTMTPFVESERSGGKGVVRG
jgi:hypothetical protein